MIILTLECISDSPIMCFSEAVSRDVNENFIGYFNYNSLLEIGLYDEVQCDRGIKAKWADDVVSRGCSGGAICNGCFCNR